MKSLYESILGSNGVGIDTLIKKWCEENGISFNGEQDYEIKNHIIYPKENTYVMLYLGQLYDELPEYIQFADGPYNLNLICERHSQKYQSIKSFRGLPENVNCLNIHYMDDIKIPELKIKTSEIDISGNGIFQPHNVLNIEYSNKCKLNHPGINPKSIIFREVTTAYKLSPKSKFKGFTKLYDHTTSSDNMFCKILGRHHQTSVSKRKIDIISRRELSMEENKDLDKLLNSAGLNDLKYIQWAPWCPQRELVCENNTWYSI